MAGLMVGANRQASERSSMKIFNQKPSRGFLRALDGCCVAICVLVIWMVLSTDCQVVDTSSIDVTRVVAIVAAALSVDIITDLFLDEDEAYGVEGDDARC